ncbi:TonB-dependent receptor [Haliscomenobacter hydrossis]|uniref:TonB-dependent receptor plug n=1 Tax=Haliscomenobacter hydrossis (strain ATCC 27775 / DSM 1100 / LMG 10767 / O) TaxID=760192 RepID=F4KTW1_HALH1|nr:TonB-dependent receptor [Haliscomenobacter hydrossis]AEE48105.1 TonB-dependent receptor plug [Haliscomenobacter hydrossis DSM 1100]
MRILLCLHLLLLSSFLLAQNATLRGNVYDEETGNPIGFASISLVNNPGQGAITDVNGFFSIANLAPGKYQINISYLGYESASFERELSAGNITYQRFLLKPTAIELEGVDISGRRSQARSQVQISKLTVSPKQIRSLPSTGGESDVAQYLTVLPGVVSSGDQGGQLYIRGGSPVQNKMLLDGMIIYNPFHSIGLFSVFETETIRNMDVYTGGYNAEYGGRISAVVDIKTREGNRKRLSGLVSASPFQAKALIEGPIKPLKNENGGSISFMFTGKHSLIDRTSPSLYSYAVDSNYYSFAQKDTSLSVAKSLPFRYTDLYGKVSFNADNGSKLDVFGFNFTDQFNFAGLAKLDWSSTGGGGNFTLIPTNSNVVLNGVVGFSNYNIALLEKDGGPRQSGITTYNANLNFTYYGDHNQLNYGFEFVGLNTDFRFRNLVGLTFAQEDFTSELAGYAKFRQELKNLVLEPGFRVHYYASQSRMSLEPRFGLKYNATPFLRFKAAGGIYAQNLVSTVNDLDVVNFFVGFLAGPEESLFKPNTREPVDHRLQKAWHAVTGVELDLGKYLEFNVEPYWKQFTQLININRNKLNAQDPNYVTETGEAYGIDFTLRYSKGNVYCWGTYSYAKVNRNDGIQEYPPIFDRRHNINLLSTYRFGGQKQWEASARWNIGSGFPFTQTRGFYQDNPYGQLLQTNVLTGNFPLGILLTDEINGGRLSWFHRLDASLKYTAKFSRFAALELTASVTNVYNRENVFYVDRITNRRVNQLPVLPSLAAAVRF